jgi:hypothetical protein
LLSRISQKYQIYYKVLACKPSANVVKIGIRPERAQGPPPSPRLTVAQPGGCSAKPGSCPGRRRARAVTAPAPAPSCGKTRGQIFSAPSASCAIAIVEKKEPRQPPTVTGFRPFGCRLKGHLHRMLGYHSAPNCPPRLPRIRLKMLELFRALGRAHHEDIAPAWYYQGWQRQLPGYGRSAVQQ